MNTRYSWLLDQNHTETQMKFTELLIREKNSPINCITNSSEADLQTCDGDMCNSFIAMNLFFLILTIDPLGTCGGKTTYQLLLE